MATRMPAIFFGHGNPMNALADNRYTQGWRRLGREIPRPRAVLCISAHWYRPGTALTTAAKPRTIHDFGGFPPELFQVQYPAPGDPELARAIQQRLEPVNATLDPIWGLDHGTWSVLCHVFPAADVPILQLSIDESLSAASHYSIGQLLAPLREDGILVIGSGNLVHNLHAYAWGEHHTEPYEWAVRFESQARAWITAAEHQPLIEYETLGKDAALSAPTPDHFLPLLYVLGTQSKGETIDFPVEGMDGGSISMLTVKVG